MIATLKSLWHIFAKYRVHVASLAALGFVGALLEGIGINAAIPLLSFLTGASSGPTDFISNAIRGLFALFHVPFIFRYLLVFILGLFFLRAIAIAAFNLST